MSLRDDFARLARYYDPIMEHVDYDRWLDATITLAELLPRPFLHLDAACGTGVLAARLRRRGWQSFGMDLSAAMLNSARRNDSAFPVAVADLRALPFCGSLDYITCLFDSMNFLLTEEDVASVLRQFHAALRPEGLLYFDIVTERMVTEHFDDQEWLEDNGTFSTRWASNYDRASGITETHIGVNTAEKTILRERIYPLELFIERLRAAGFSVLDASDAETWRAPRRRSTRIDIVAWKGNDDGRIRRRFNVCRKALRKRA